MAADVSITKDKRTERKLEVGRDIPTPTEVKRLIEAASDRKHRTLLRTAAFTGLRASELRGLRWSDVDLKEGELHVRQRADRYNKIGLPKTASSQRTVPLGPQLILELKAWKLACPNGEGTDFVFPTSTGRVDHHANMLRGLNPVMKAAGLTDKKGRAKYALHSFAITSRRGASTPRIAAARVAAQGCSRLARALVHRYDPRPLRPSVPARR